MCSGLLIRCDFAERTISARPSPASIAAAGALIKKVTFLTTAWDARAFAVFDDIDGNGVQELGVVARKDTGDIKVQLRDALTGVKIRTIVIP